MGSLNPARTVEELKELRELTADDDGAQRVCWTETWTRAREWMRHKLAALPVEVEVDEAGNQWATLAGASPRAVLLGGHIDSVPNGGWLDGSLNLLAGLECLRRVASQGTPPVTVRLVDWADEEGARFGYSLLGSSACAGSLDPQAVRGLRDKDGVSLPEALAGCGVELDAMLDCRRQLDSALAYLELHIEQGPVLESLDLPLGVVQGTFGVERHLIGWRGQSAHAGSTPMDQRRDTVCGAARLALEVREAAKRHGGVATVGRVTSSPGIVNAIAGQSQMTLDQRHLEASALARMKSEAEASSHRIAAEEGLEVEWECLWRIDPIAFDPRLIDLTEDAIRQVAGACHRLPSGPLHDASAVASAGIPTVMLFVQSLRGLSHTRLEDTKTEHLELAVRALDGSLTRVMERPPRG